MRKEGFLGRINLDFVLLSFPYLGFCDCLAFLERLDQCEMPESVVQQLKGFPFTDGRVLGAHNHSDEPHPVALGGGGKVVSGCRDVSCFEAVDRRVFEQKLISIVLMDVVVSVFLHGMEAQRFGKCSK